LLSIALRDELLAILHHLLATLDHILADLPRLLTAALVAVLTVRRIA
jgi:hypothetical protein